MMLGLREYTNSNLLRSGGAQVNVSREHSQEKVSSTAAGGWEFEMEIVIRLTSEVILLVMKSRKKLWRRFRILFRMFLNSLSSAWAHSLTMAVAESAQKPSCYDRHKRILSCRQFTVDFWRPGLGSQHVTWNITRRPANVTERVSGVSSRFGGHSSLCNVFSGSHASIIGNLISTQHGAKKQMLWPEQGHNSSTLWYRSYDFDHAYVTRWLNSLRLHALQQLRLDATIRLFLHEFNM